MLKDKATVQKMVVNVVYGTMMLEEQHVSKERLNELYLKAVKEKIASQ